MKTTAAQIACLLASASAFAPTKLASAPPTRRSENILASTLARSTHLDLNSSSSSNADQLQPKCSSKRKKIIRRVGKLAGAAASIALATSTVSFPAHAATKTAKDIISIADVTENAAKLYVIGTGAFVAGFRINSARKEKGKSPKFQHSLHRHFPKYGTNKDLVSTVQKVLRSRGFHKNKSLVATSFCADEVNRGLERDFSKTYSATFNMGGLAGFPFGGITSFGAMASHIPDGGSCLVVFGPHVGVDSTGKVGTVERRGRANGGACCGSAVAASGYASAIYHRTHSRYGPPEKPDDAQQNFVGTALLPYAAHLEAAEDKMTELPYALYDAQKKLMGNIIQAGAANVAGDGKIAVLGGIQINTPHQTDDLFLPLSFELYNNEGELIEDLSPAIGCGRPMTYSKWAYYETPTSTAATTTRENKQPSGKPIMDIPPAPLPVVKTVDATCFDKFDGEPANGNRGLAQKVVQPIATVGSIAAAASDFISSASGTF